MKILESELSILPQKIDRSPEWWSDRIGDRLWYGFDGERIQAEKNDRNDDLSALVIWPEGESLDYCIVHSVIMFMKLGQKLHNKLQGIYHVYFGIKEQQLSTLML